MTAAQDGQADAKLADTVIAEHLAAEYVGRLLTRRGAPRLVRLIEGAMTTARQDERERAPLSPLPVLDSAARERVEEALMFAIGEEMPMGVVWNLGRAADRLIAALPGLAVVGQASRADGTATRCLTAHPHLSSDTWCMDTPTVVQPAQPDDLDTYLAEQRRNPEFAAAWRAIEARELDDDGLRLRLLRSVEAAEISLQHGLTVDWPTYVASLRRVLDDTSGDQQDDTKERK